MITNMKKIKKFGKVFIVLCLFAVMTAGYEVSAFAGEIDPDEKNIGESTLEQVDDIDVYISQLDGQRITYYSYSDINGRVPMTKEELARQSVEASIEGDGFEGNISVEVEPTDVGFDIIFKSAVPVKEIKTGRYILRYKTHYKNPNGTDSMSNEVTVKVNVMAEPHSISMKADVPVSMDYYQISRLDSDGPVKITILKDGLKLTDSELTGMKMVSDVDEIPEEGENTLYCVIDTDGLECDIKKVPGESAVSVMPKKTSNGPAAGDYRITAFVRYFDNNGIPVDSELSKKITIGILPWWLKWVIIALGIAAGLVILWLFMRMKVLPKDIKAGDSGFTIGRNELGGNPVCKLHKSSRTRGTIKIQSPTNPAVPNGDTYLDVSIEALDSRWVSSKKRRVKIISTPNAGSYEELTALTVGNTDYEVVWTGVGSNRHPVGLFPAGTDPDDTAPVSYGTLKNNEECIVSKKVKDPRGRNVSVVFSVTLRFK